MNVLVTLRQAKASLGLPLEVTVDDGMLQDLLDAAHAVTAKFIKQRRIEGESWAAVVDGWDEDTAPADVKQQIKMAFGFLYRNRGDNDAPLPLALGELPRELTALIWGYRDPTVA